MYPTSNARRVRNARRFALLTILRQQPLGGDVHQITRAMPESYRATVGVVRRALMALTASGALAQHNGVWVHSIASGENGRRILPAGVMRPLTALRALRQAAGADFASPGALAVR